MSGFQKNMTPGAPDAVTFADSSDTELHSRSSLHMLTVAFAFLILLAITAVTMFIAIRTIRFIVRRNDLREIQRSMMTQQRVQHPAPGPVPCRRCSANLCAMLHGEEYVVQLQPTRPAEATKDGSKDGGTGTVVDGVVPLSYVVMAGEERATALAYPLPERSSVDASRDSNLDGLEQGKKEQS